MPHNLCDAPAPQDAEIPLAHRPQMNLSNWPDGAFPKLDGAVVHRLADHSTYGATIHANPD